MDCQKIQRRIILKQFLNLKVGDKVLFDYSVVAERKFESDGAYFTEITKDSPYYQKVY
jgi:hypothetical protein